MPDDFLTVGEVSQLVGVSVRTLHYYESVGILAPSARSHAGYRLYSSADIEVLHTILVYRSLEFSLDTIRHILCSQQSPLEELVRQRDLLKEKQEHLQSVMDSVQTMIEVHTMNKKMSAAQRAQASYAQYRQEAEEKYGATDSYRQSAQRVATFSNSDWESVTASTEAFEAACAVAMQEGVAPGSVRANELAEEHLGFMRIYFDCSYEQQALIALTYVSDPRFTAHYEVRAAGLAKWLQRAIHANATLHGVDVEQLVWQ